MVLSTGVPLCVLPMVVCLYGMGEVVCLSLCGSITALRDVYLSLIPHPEPFSVPG